MTAHRMTVHSIGALEAGGDDRTNFVMLTGGAEAVKDIGKAFGEEIEITRAPGAAANDAASPDMTAALNVVLRAVHVMRRDLRSAIEIGCLAQNGAAEVSALAPPTRHSLGEGMRDYVAGQITAIREAMALLDAHNTQRKHDDEPYWLSLVIDGSLDIFPRERTAP